MKDDDREFFKAIRKGAESIPIFLIPKKNNTVWKKKWAVKNKKYLNEEKYSITLWTANDLDYSIGYVKSVPWPLKNMKAPLNGLSNYFTGIKEDIRKQLLGYWKECERFVKASNIIGDKLVKAHPGKSYAQMYKEGIELNFPAFSKTLSEKFVSPINGFWTDIRDILKDAPRLSYSGRLVL
jgi:hypothetical protein